MATFTIELCDVLELETDIGLNEYPLFDESYRPALNKKIVDHFYNREIGMETVSMFRHQLRRRMNEIMPLYNQHYEASRIKIDPLKTIDIRNVGNMEATSNATGHAETATTGHEQTDTTGHGQTDTTGNSATTSASDAKSRAVASDHPQENLSGTGDYATSSNDAISNTTANGTSDDTTSATRDDTGSAVRNDTGTATQDDTNTATQNASNTGSTTGFTGNQAAVIFQLRQTFVNVDMMVIGDLEDLFMLVWSNADDYYGRQGMGYFDNYTFGFPF
jgi:hypothetical protein